MELLPKVVQETTHQVLTVLGTVARSYDIDDALLVEI
jgi:hypothetical protein